MMWRLGEKTSVFSNEWLKINKLVYYKGDSEAGQDFYVVQGKDWVNTVPITQNGMIALVREFRHGVAKELLGLPGGLIDPTDASPACAAQRESREELNIDQILLCRPLGQMTVNASTHTNTAHSFLLIIPEMHRAPAPNPSEFGVTPELVDFATILKSSFRGDGLTSGYDIAAITRAAFTILSDTSIPVREDVRTKLRAVMSGA